LLFLLASVNLEAQKPYKTSNQINQSFVEKCNEKIIPESDISLSQKPLEPSLVQYSAMPQSFIWDKFKNFVKESSKSANGQTRKNERNRDFRNIAYQQLAPNSCGYVIPYSAVETSKNAIAQPTPQYFINYNNNGYVINHVYSVPQPNAVHNKSFDSTPTMPKKPVPLKSKELSESVSVPIKSDHKRASSMTNTTQSRPGSYKPYTLKEYQIIRNTRYENSRGLGANIGTPEWNAKKQKLDKMHEFARSVEQINKILFMDSRAINQYNYQRRTSGLDNINIGYSGKNGMVNKYMKTKMRRCKNWRLDYSSLNKNVDSNL